MITIDSQDLLTTWGIEPYRDNFYSNIMKDAGLKDRIVGDYPDTSGVIIPRGQSYTKSQELVLSFLCDSYDHYVAFLTYCVAQKVVNMYVPEIDETLRLEYMACSSFNKAGDYNVFAVRFQEANPMRRYGIFPFCAPVGFDVQRQAVDIVAKYHEYNNVDKRYMFTLRSGVDKFALTQGESVLHGYELNGVKHEDTYNVPNCVLSIDLPIGNYSEIEVNSTIGFNDSGTIILTGNPLYTFDTLNKRQFTYTSKTETKFIGESQYLSQNSSSGYSVLNLINLFGINTYIIVCGNTDNVARVLDSYGSINNIHTPSYEWLYCGKNMSSIMGSNSGLGYGSIKYIHTELKNQLTYLPKNNDSSYYVFWNCPLAGTLKIQESMTHFGYVDEAEYNRAVVCNSNLITKVIIGENIISIVNGFGNGVARVDSLALIAPETAIISFSSTIKPELHIKPNATGYNVAPWTDTNIFTQIIQDL